MAITTRAVKGSALTHTEVDTNFTDLRDGVDMQYPKTKGLGIKVDSLGTPTFPWIDLFGTGLQIDSAGNPPTFATYRNGLKANQFNEVANDEAFIDFHIPHDYVMGSDIFIHIHWSQISTTLTGGSCTWGFEYIYAKGHDQAAFPASKTVTILQNASTTQYQHMIAEDALSITSGSASLIDSDDLEPDGIIQMRVYLDSNDLTDSVTVPDPFVHFVDIHYQTTGLGTKQKAPDFWT